MDKAMDVEIPALTKRCPRCKSLSLEYNPKTGKIICRKCGFEQGIKVK